MKYFLILSCFVSILINCIGQNQNISNGNLFDGEPYIAINPENPKHMVVAWMGFSGFNPIALKTKVSFDAGENWSAEYLVPHAHPAYQSADPSIEFDNAGTVFLSYVDYNTSIDSGAVYIVKSLDDGLSWGPPIEVIDVHADPGNYPSDRPWMSIDNSGGPNNGNVYVTTMPPAVFGPISPPYHPYFIASTDGGDSFNNWQYLDTTEWLAGNLISQPMPSNCVSANGTFHAVYPSFLASQSFSANYFIASSSDAGSSFTYNLVHSASSGLTTNDGRKGQLIRSNPINANHLAFLYIDETHGDFDVFLRESFDEGQSWTGPIRVNDDPISNNRMQDLVWADFDLDGDLVVSWRDRRNGIDSTFATKSEIWAAFRDKDSTNFSSNFRISDNDVAMDSTLASAGNDFMCIKLVNDTLNAVWGDSRTGRLNVWFQRISTQGIILSANQLSGSERVSVDLYPNPALSSIIIRGKDIERYAIFTSDGRRISSNKIEKNSGEVEIDLSWLPKGNYLIQVTTTAGVLTKNVIKE